MAVKLSSKDQYKYLTRDLMWEPKDFDMKTVYPLIEKEGIHIKDPKKWEDPFRMTYNQYVKIQSEKDSIYHSVVNAFEANHGHAKVVDSRWYEGVKAFAVAVQPAEYQAHRLMAYIGRNIPIEAIRFATFAQAIDELRHAQIEIKHYAHMSKYYDGLHSYAKTNENHWFNTVPKSFFEDALSAGPFEALMAISFSFEYCFTNILFLPFASSAAAVGDEHFAATGKTVQSDESRHMALGMSALKMLLEEDDRNVPIVQKWLDKWYWRAYRMFSVVSVIVDYYPRIRPISWKKAFEIYIEDQVFNGLFKDLRKYGIRLPLHAEDSIKEKEHYSHATMRILDHYKHANVFRTFKLQPDDYEWLASEYPNTFDQYYASYYKRQGDHALAVTSPGIPSVCKVCQIPLEFVNPDKPTQQWTQYSEYNGDIHMTCSPGCKHLFESEPQKYMQMWWPAEAYVSGEFGENVPMDLFKYLAFSPEEAGEHYSSRDRLRWLQYRQAINFDKRFK
ncbi:phenol 2-monooxygenase P3 subunit [Schinkia azotoformans MEV2011]|uniref:propane 2-monooxygenase n=1 Tax=Schinkia azotoformans MEV2011 TaxID=1348973 RepID=A0A072NJN5_SCHAZ|nr:toluene hydroxylase [Schinkia azotoformans]KEF37487.1 phenol 2-monooxygenase P3 subunit [Schinkia azotoformans MEV2011]MEC1740080.1 toluene hydroxylase [Schinkia azotoformans]MEC1769119.1 toluene hydroxylase [Schinkia azotoformans]MEC1770464.1 toluene hydroxylase [Schinkia azotoformans]MED4330793.1 toluene hydroxylase [Schinkia azotoformans]